MTDIPPDVSSLQRTLVEPPMVSALMITGKDPSRRKMAIAAVRSFVDQSYSPKELIIVNHGDPLGIELTNVREHLCERRTLGEMRNKSIELAGGAWCIQWDDDDYSHPHRIMTQMAARREGYAVLLGAQIRFCTLNMHAFVAADLLGHAGSILFPKTDARYEALESGEDSRFWMTNFPGKTIRVQNERSYPGAALLVRLCHETNVTNVDSLMLGHTGKEYQNKWASLSPDHRYFLAKTIENYGYKVS